MARMYGLVVRVLLYSVYSDFCGALVLGWVAVPGFGAVNSWPVCQLIHSAQRSCYRVECTQLGKVGAHL